MNYVSYFYLESELPEVKVTCHIEEDSETTAICYNKVRWMAYDYY